MSDLVYIAHPYLHRSNQVQAARIQLVKQYTEMLLEKDEVIPFAPIVMTRQFAMNGVQPKRGWYEWDLQYLKRCDEMHLLCLPGWRDSEGVQLEITFCQDNEIPITYIEYTHLIWELNARTRLIEQNV